MNIQALNTQLCNVYKEFWQTTYSILPKEKGLSAPLFSKISCDCKQFFMMVGQQTRGWQPEILNSNDPDPVKCLMNAYECFKMGEKYAKSPFGNASKRMNNKLKSSGYGFIWSNIITADQALRRPDPEIEEIICQYGLLRREISIMKGQAIVFFTGPCYDNRIKSVFPDVSFTPIPLYEKYLCRLQHPILPFHSYRTYHPNYLRRRKQMNNILDHVSLLILDEPNKAL